MLHLIHFYTMLRALSFFLSFFLSSRFYKYKFWIGRFRDDKEICRREKQSLCKKSGMVNREKGGKAEESSRPSQSVYVQWSRGHLHGGCSLCVWVWVCVLSGESFPLLFDNLISSDGPNFA
jgi:hypothetical protein